MGYRDMHKEACKGALFFAGNWEWDGADMGSQMDMPTCSDACTHPNQGVGPDEGLLT